MTEIVWVGYSLPIQQSRNLEMTADKKSKSWHQRKNNWTMLHNGI